MVLATHGEDVVVVGVFSVLPPSPKETWLLIDEKNPHFPATGLKRSSVVKGEKVAVLHRSIVHSTIGSFPSDILRAVSQRVKIALQLD